MRFRHPDGTTVHLSYCTNVHPAEDLAGVLDQLARYAGPVRDRLGVDRLGVGLWLARDLASHLAEPSALARLRAGLAAHGLEVVTLNGFPYRGFHAPVVKHAVYSPDWSTPDRLRYTVDLARLLARLLPDDADRGSVSTLPLAWRTAWQPARRDAVRANLDLLAKELTAVGEQEGRTVTVGFEPEPGCVMESTWDAVRELSDVDRDRIGLCLDACHLAVAFEEPAAALGRLAAAGIGVAKLQASCALHAEEPADPNTRLALASFAEPRFLHQARECVPGGPPLAVDDLDAALASDGPLPGRAPWRVHFHAPLHAVPAAPLTTTRAVLEATLAGLLAGPVARTHHVEVETYTWQVLPAAARPDGPDDLVAGIAAELAWARDALVALGLEVVA